MPAAGAAALVAGCSTFGLGGGGGPEPGSELVGRSLRVRAANGEVTTLRFRDEDSVRATFRGRTLDGRWDASDRRLCFRWPRAPRECWPYRSRFERGRTRTVTSDRGNVVRVTLL